ncbi:hypothetical protein [Blastopirellula marina]|uniref:Uncharacterized protein n=1 Tax=Blastopirellula marina DSM 3645 TaxID=314230 RepID=A3ZPH9_9BACT|nr:hypothetical protein [Blastopirellula marina]EAQ81657.1 hypothetical protein DSM3645_28787 [Blastopirellula marina DSM 3645]
MPEFYRIPSAAWQGPKTSGVEGAIDGDYVLVSNVNVGAILGNNLNEVVCTPTFPRAEYTAYVRFRAATGSGINMRINDYGGGGVIYKNTSETVAFAGADRWFVVSGEAFGYYLAGVLTVGIGGNLQLFRQAGVDGHVDDVIFAEAGAGYATEEEALANLGGSAETRRIHRLGLGGNLGVRR